MELFFHKKVKKPFLVPDLVLSYACIMKRRPLSTYDSKRKVEQPRNGPFIKGSPMRDVISILAKEKRLPK